MPEQLNSACADKLTLFTSIFCSLMMKKLCNWPIIFVLIWNTHTLILVLRNFLPFSYFPPPSLWLWWWSPTFCTCAVCLCCWGPFSGIFFLSSFLSNAEFFHTKTLWLLFLFIFCFVEHNSESKKNEDNSRMWLKSMWIVGDLGCRIMFVRIFKVIRFCHYF